MGWWAAIAGAAKAFSEVFTWKTGGRTKDENALRDEAEHWKEEYDKAMAGRDYQHASFALSRLRKLRDEARSKS